MADYRYEPFQNRYAGAIAGTLREMGESRARAALQVADAQARATQARGDVWGQAIGNIGQAIGSIPAQMQQAKAQQQAGEIRALQLREAKAEDAARMRAGQEAQALSALFAEGEPKPEAVYRVVGPERGAKILTGLAALKAENQKAYGSTQTILRDVLAGMDATPEPLRASVYPGIRETLVQRGAIKPEDAPEAYDPQWFATVRGYGQAPAKPAEGFTLGEGQVRYDATGKPIAEVPKPEKPAAAAAPGTFGDYLTRVGKPLGEITAAEMRKHKADYEAAGRAPAAEKSRLWVVRDGETMRVSENEIRPGDRPANTREQGRPVTSGDASDLADFDTSLDELKAVRAAISDKDSTGIVARVGATLPYVTQITGWGADAKKRQAVIDRVKQVIGKTLEGGVLRKEDEAKYEKILPNIGDAPDVAASKLNGLDTAIATRKQRRLDALSDANYDVSKYVARTPAAANQGGSAPMRRAIPGVEGGVAESTDGGKTWKRVQ